MFPRTIPSIPALTDLNEEEEGVYEIDDAKCKMGTMDIKLDKDFKVLLISRY